MRFSLILLLVAGTCSAVEFNRDVRPILSDKCFHCHGTDAKVKGIKLRLDSESAAKSELPGNRWAIAPGDPARSELVKRITHPNRALRMPPQQSGLELTPREIETLTRWIQEGARWEKHWSFVPPVNPDFPDVSKPEWVRNGIDRFILSRLDREGLTPSSAPPKDVLLRRVSLDLTGLPPTPEEMSAFLADSSPEAYEKAVDRLLASPRYGERMAAVWLDAARYADTNGYQYDGERQMWRWRDWVIASFNRNQPYDQFLTEQLAGDLLPDPTLDQRIATGFNRNHRANTEDGIIPAEYAVEYVADRVETTSAVFLGLTMGCARCHNHKYDPFTQREFYQLYAFFNNIPERGRGDLLGNSPPVVAAPDEKQQRAWGDLHSRIAAAEAKLQIEQAKLRPLQQLWERSISDDGHWAPRDPDHVFDFSEAVKDNKDQPIATAPGIAGPALKLDGDQFFPAPEAGKYDTRDKWTMMAWIRPDTVDGSIMSRMADNPKGKGYGVHLVEGRLHVNLTSAWADDAIRIETTPVVKPGEWQHITVTYDGTRAASGFHIFVNGEPVPFDVQFDAIFRPFTRPGLNYKETFRIGTGWGAKKRFRGLIDEVRLYGRTLLPTEIAAAAQRQTVAELARVPVGNRSPAQTRVLQWAFWESTAAPDDVRTEWAALHKLRREQDMLERSFPTVMVMEEMPVPRKTHILNRGAYDQPGEEVQPNVPEVLPPFPADAPRNRLGLARWMTAPNHPLTARVAVNRFWQLYFGTGLVKTSEDFGLQGEWPSHPELLDWLAVKFVESGWDVKALQKLIVTSATYRQASDVSPDLLQRDPENRLLARGPRLRLRPEMIRDGALFSAGLLQEKLGGPSVKPYQPAGLWEEQAMTGQKYVQGTGADLYRRSLYTFWKRTVAPPMMVNFDAATRESCTVRETRTNTPLQALNLMNDVTFLEAARLVGQRVLLESGPDDLARLRYAYILVLGTSPSESEINILRQSLQFHREYFSEDPGRGEKYLKQGEKPSDPALPAPELAAHTAVASLLFNMDKAVTKQ